MRGVSYLSGSLKTDARECAKYKLELRELRELRRDKAAVNVAVNYGVGEVPENQLDLNMNGICQLLLCADGFHL